MNERTKKGVGIAALIALLLMATGFGGEPGGGGGTGDDDIPPKPETPCPPGFHYEFDQAARKWECVADPLVGPPDPEDIDIIQDPTDPLGPVGPADITDPAEPPSDDPNDYIKPYPTGGNFYQVVFGDFAYGEDPDNSIVYRYLRTEGFLAAKEFGGVTDAQANDFGKLVAGNNDNRVKAWTQIIGCSGVNDLAYATWGYSANVQPIELAFTGRMIRLVPQHPDNLSRLLNGQGLSRCIRLGTQATKGNGSGTRVPGASGCNSYELLWLPQINRQALWESGGDVLKTEDGELWSDGTSKGLPPPFVTDRTFHPVPGSLPQPTPKVWGCFDLALEYEG